MTYVVYVLQDEYGKRYKGMTSDLARRLIEHRGGHTRTTARMGKELHIIYQETCIDRQTARLRERCLKSAAGRRFLDQCVGKQPLSGE